MKNVIITGGTGGLGNSLIEKYAQNGYDILFTYLNNETKAFELVNYIKSKYNVNCYKFKCDIASEENVKELRDYAKDVLGTVDVLVNNAAISCDNELKNKSVSEFKKVIDVNLVGTFSVSKYISELMESGSIINVASNDGIDTCYKEEMDYAASKAGVISLTKTFAKELAPNIRVNAVAPGWMKTDMSDDDLKDKDESWEAQMILLNRFGKTEEVANVIYFLTSNEASYINGEIIKVDGGY